MSAKIWLIDDDPINHLICSSMISKAGLDAEVKSFDSAIEALACLQQSDNQPDQILLDLNMPGMDGWEFLTHYQRLKIQGRLAPVTILSSSINPEDIERARQHPAVNSYLVKPLQIEALKALPYLNSQVKSEINYSCAA